VREEKCSETARVMRMQICLTTIDRSNSTIPWHLIGLLYTQLHQFAQIASLGATAGKPRLYLISE